MKHATMRAAVVVSAGATELFPTSQRGTAAGWLAMLWGPQMVARYLGLFAPHN